MRAISHLNYKTSGFVSVLGRSHFVPSKSLSQGKKYETLPSSNNLQTTTPLSPESLTKTSWHHVFAFGQAQTGALGLSEPSRKRTVRPYMPRPLRLRFTEKNKVLTVRAGYGFSVFYVENESPVKLFGCGVNTNLTQGRNSDKLVPYPVPLNILLDPSTKLTSLSCGRAHIALTTDKEGAFLFGSNNYGQCGKSFDLNDQDEFVVNRINGFDCLIICVDCGQDHTLFLTEIGEVYACGWGFQAVPSRLRGDIENERIIKVTGKSDTMLAINARGEIFGWGNSELGQLSPDREIQHVIFPRHLKHVNSLCGPIADIAAGEGSCAVVNRNGDVYVWGWGILGAGPELISSLKPVLIPRTLFGCNEYQPDARTVKIYSGLNHMAAVNNQHHLYTWGRNRQGCLGIGHFRDQYFPYKVSIGGDSVDVTCGFDHTMVLCR